MSSMRRVAEAACRTPEAQSIDNTETPREPQKMADTQHVDEERDSIQRQFPPTERHIPTNGEQHSDWWEGTNVELEIIIEQAPLLNGGPPTLCSEHGTIQESTTMVPATPVTTTRTMPIESVPISSTAQVDSPGMEKRVPTTKPICLPEEDPQIPCPVCDVIDCMIHNPRHRYCMNYGQRLLGPHACPNEREHPKPPPVHHPVPIGVTKNYQTRKEN